MEGQLLQRTEDLMKHKWGSCSCHKGTKRPHKCAGMQKACESIVKNLTQKIYKMRQRLLTLKE